MRKRLICEQVEWFKKICRRDWIWLLFIVLVPQNHNVSVAEVCALLGPKISRLKEVITISCLKGIIVSFGEVLLRDLVWPFLFQTSLKLVVVMAIERSQIFFTILMDRVLVVVIPTKSFARFTARFTLSQKY